MTTTPNTMDVETTVSITESDLVELLGALQVAAKVHTATGDSITASSQFELHDRVTEALRQAKADEGQFTFVVNGKEVLVLRGVTKSEALRMANEEVTPTLVDFYAWNDEGTPGRFHAMFGVFD